MYIITDHRFAEPSIIAGPSEWKPKLFSFRLSEELDYEVIIKDEDKSKVPYFIAEGIAIRECDVVYEDMNGVFQKHEGPSITYSDNGEQLEKATATYFAANKSITEIKKYFKDKIASERWEKENEFISINIGEETYMIQASRSTRDALTQKYIAMNEDSIVNWKFRFRWATLTRADVLMILKAIDNHVQTHFDKEVEIIAALEEALDHEALKGVVLQRELI